MTFPDAAIAFAAEHDAINNKVLPRASRVLQRSLIIILLRALSFYNDAHDSDLCNF